MSDKITISKTDIQAASRQGAMSPQDVDSLWAHLLAQSSNSSAAKSSGGFDFAQLAWYGGGVLVMIAMAWFMERAGSLFGSGGMLALSLTYAAAFGLLGFKLKYRDNQPTPGGILFVLTVLMAPIATFSLLDIFATGMPWDNRALIAEMVTIAAGIFAASRVRFGFLSAPVFGALWLLSMTVSGMTSGMSLFWTQSFLQTSMLIGGGILALALTCDLTFGRKVDYAWWGYLFGVAAFWIPLTFLDSGGEVGKLVYFGINIAMLITSVVLARKVFLVAGSIGAIYYVGHLLWTFFAGSIGFPLALIGCGVAIIYLGVAYRRNQGAIENAVLGFVPEGVRQRLPRG